MLNIINTCQPYIAGGLIFMGFTMCLLSWLGYLQTTRANVQTWTVVYAAILVGLFLIIGGFYIAHW